MSELEIQRRQEYKRNRKKLTMIQLIAIAVLVAITLGSFLVYRIMDRTYYIEYKEQSNIDYKVQYEKNEYFTEEWIGKDQSYISSLVNGIAADFNYDFNMPSAEMGFNYTYRIDAKLLIANKDSGAPYFTVEDGLYPATNKVIKSASNLSIKESVLVDYSKYDEIARSFIDAYDIDNATSTLIVTLYVDVKTSAKQIKAGGESSYSTSLNIPVAEDTFNIHSTSSSPDGAVNHLTYKGAANRNVFKVIGIVFACLSLAATALLLIFLHISKNEDITYAARIRKILSSYGSFIQRMEGEFDYEGYQIVMIKTFTELLGIRDTIQSPILMSENRDETMTRFFIPTNTRILYIFEIKVDNYDEIYNTVEEAVVEEPVILEEVDQEVLDEAMEQPDVVLDEVEFIPDDDDQFEVPPEEPGIEVVGVVWKERAHKNKVYRYDPNGEVLEEGDIVLVPTRDAARGRDVIRKAAIAHGNHRVDPEHIKYPLKKVIAIIRRKTAHALTPAANEEIRKLQKEKNS